MKRGKKIVPWRPKVLILVLLALAMGACTKLSDPNDGSKFIVDYTLLKTNIAIECIDAQTGMLIGQEDDKKVRLIVTGESADAVLDLSGSSHDYYMSAHGLISLALNPAAKFLPSESAPLHLSFVASLDGYFTASQSLSISRDGNYNLKIFMVDRENPPEGVTIVKAENVGSLVQGIVQDELTVETEDGMVRLTLPAGTIVKDDHGGPLNASLTITLAYFSNTEQTSLAAFPGGLIGRVAQDGQILDGTFFSAGFMAIEVVDAIGKEASTFENNAILRMNLNAETYNPDTKNKVAAGDALPLYTYEADSGHWVYNQTVEVVAANNGLQATAHIDHLSYWGFDWFVEGICRAGIGLKFTGMDCDGATMEGIMRKKADNTYLSYVYLYAFNDSIVHLLNAPKNLPVYIDWNTPLTSCMSCEAAPGTNPLAIANPCAANTLEVPVICQNSGISVMLNLTGYCVNNPSMAIKPSFGVWFRPADSYCWRWMPMVDGVAQLYDVEAGKDYILGMYISGGWRQTVVPVDVTEQLFVDIEFPAEFCNQGF